MSHIYTIQRFVYLSWARFFFRFQHAFSNPLCLPRAHVFKHPMFSSALYFQMRLFAQGHHLSTVYVFWHATFSQTPCLPTPHVFKDPFLHTRSSTNSDSVFYLNQFVARIFCQCTDLQLQKCGYTVADLLSCVTHDPDNVRNRCK